MATITLRRDAVYQAGIFVSGDGTRGVPYRESLAGKTTAVVGLAKSGVAAARLLRRLGVRVLASDSSPLESLTEEARALDREGCTLWAGGHPDAAFVGADLVVVSPGVPLELPALASVRARGVPIIGSPQIRRRPTWMDHYRQEVRHGKSASHPARCRRDRSARHPERRRSGSCRSSRSHPGWDER